MLIIHYTSIPGNLGVKGGIAFSVALPLTRYPFPHKTASICCTTLVNELPAPKSQLHSKGQVMLEGRLVPFSCANMAFEPAVTEVISILNLIAFNPTEL